MNISYETAISSLLKNTYHIEEESFKAAYPKELDKIGKQDSEVIVLINSSLQEKDKQFLEKVLQAVNIPLDQVLIIFISDNRPSYTQLANEFPFKKLIAFGLSPLNLKLKFTNKHYQLFLFQNKKLLFAEDISILSTDVSKKKLLWAGLQKMFELKS